MCLRSTKSSSGVGSQRWSSSSLPSPFHTAGLRDAISETNGGTARMAGLTLFRIAEHANLAQSVELVEFIEQMLCLHENGSS